MTDRDPLLDIRDRMNAALAAGKPHRIIRAANLRTTAWRQDATHLDKKVRRLWYGGEIRRCDQLALTGEHLGLERVGLILEPREVDS